MTKISAPTANGGASAKAMDYTLRRWASFIRYVETGHLSIDNNVVENCIRPIALGKRTACFSLRNHIPAFQNMGLAVSRSYKMLDPSVILLRIEW